MNVSARSAPPSPTSFGNTRRMVARLGAVVLALVLARPAAAEPDQLIGLFMQSCLPFVGDAQGLRKWAAGVGLPPLPQEGQKAFLGAQPGEVFDASTPQAKFVVISGDNGACAVMAEEPAPSDINKAVEGALASAGIDARVIGEGDDPKVPALHHRAYLARKGSRSWRIVLSTGAHAMLSASN